MTNKYHNINKQQKKNINVNGKKDDNVIFLVTQAIIIVIM